MAVVKVEVWVMRNRVVLSAALLSLGLCAGGAEGPQAGLTVKAIAAGCDRSLA